MRLSNVLENGNGSPGSLAVLYLELAARLSLALQPVALEGGRYFVLQPAEGGEGASLAAGGERFVIDPYSEGMLLAESEVGGWRCWGRRRAGRGAPRGVGAGPPARRCARPPSCPSPWALPSCPGQGAV